MQKKSLDKGKKGKMKKLISNFIVLLTVVMSSHLYAQITTTKIVEKDTVKTLKKATINSSEKEIKTIAYKGITYYIIDGIWYTKMKKKYVLRAAPKGAKINFKPSDGEYVTMYGKKYYKCKGVFYKELKDTTYQVVML